MAYFDQKIIIARFYAYYPRAESLVAEGDAGKSVGVSPGPTGDGLAVAGTSIFKKIHSSVQHR